VQTTDSDVALNLEQLRNLTLEDPKLMREILWALIDDTCRQAALLETALRDRDPQRAIRLARYSSRACDNVGANPAAAALRLIERGASHGDFDRAREGLVVLQAEMDRLRVEAAGLDAAAR
jgi:HPt (histidine-containing phosphotransfer) domain-containing protein